MDKAEIRAAVVKVITAIAPDISVDELIPEIDLRADLDIDSMDFLNIIVGLHEKLQVDIPEADYPRLTTLAAFIDYLSDKLG
ncbi:MAG: acyl carrier protein [Candidatus Lambdaproteobacteria bacterium]|nr:acyl carrier protein [Candidatus Lambdaproteobacteria bacterium]